MVVENIRVILKHFYFSRMQGPALIKGKRKNMHSSKPKTGEQIRKNRKLARKNGEAFFFVFE